MMPTTDMLCVLAATAAGGDGSIDMWMRFMGRLHPMVVHFPLALILTALLVEVGCFFRRGHRVSTTAFVCLVLAVITGGAAAWFGWLNADHEPHASSVADTLMLHRWSGIGAIGAAILALLLAGPARLSRGNVPRQAYLLMLVTASTLVAAGGYFGGELVHGPEYLTSVLNGDASTRPVAPVPTMTAAAPPTGPTESSAPAASPPDQPAVTVARVAAPEVMVPPEAVDPTRVVAIIENECARCHGPLRQKGGVQLAPISEAFAVERADWVILPGDPGASKLIHRISLPDGHPDLMPRGGKRLPEETIGLIYQWIAMGAPPPPAPAVAVADPPSTPAVTPPATTPPATPPATSPPATPPPATVPPSPRQLLIDALVARGGTVTPIGTSSNQLDISLAGFDPKATDADLAQLVELGDGVVWLNLAGSAVTDDGMQHVAKLKKLERLRLEQTAITDAGLEQLAGLGELTHLNVYGTAVTDEGLDTIGGFEKLQRVYLWQTEVTVVGVAQLRVKRPKLRIIRSAPVAPLEEKTPEGQKEPAAETAEAVEETPD